jgi:hypothetical protein
VQVGGPDFPGVSCRNLVHPTGDTRLADEPELEVVAELDEADDDEDDAELLDVGVADSDALLAVDDGAAEELAAVELARAVVAGEDGVVGVLPVDEEELASSPSVVVPDDEEWLTSADTGFCPMSSIPVTIAIATTNTETA